jgi:hypothetical protein
MVRLLGGFLLGPEETPPLLFPDSDGGSGAAMAENFTHVWYWRPRCGERNRKGLRCCVIVRGRRNSILVQLEDGEMVVTSRYAVRRIARNG